MSVNEIETAIEKLSREELTQLRDWLEDFCEDQLELTDDVKAKLDDAREDIAAGRYRVRKPQD